jgi:hypothetical protein
MGWADASGSDGIGPGRGVLVVDGGEGEGGPEVDDDDGEEGRLAV